MKPHRRSRRHLAVTMIASVATMGVLSGCATASPDAAGVDTIRVVDYHGNEPISSIIGGMLDDCGAEHGVEIEREIVPSDSLVSKVLQQASSKTLPDILMLDNPDLQQIATTGALVPLAELDVDLEGYAESILEAGSYEGEVYALAPTVNTIALYYNVDLFEQAGIEAPSTWAELSRAATALTEGNRYGIAFSADASATATWQFLPVLWSNGASEDDLTSQEALEALEFWTSLVTDGSASQSVLNWDQIAVVDQFKAGTAAMMINGPYQHPRLAEVPDLNYKSIPIPVQTAGDEHVSPLGGTVWTVPRSDSAERQNVAARIVECLNNEENQIEEALARSTVPSKVSAAGEYAELAPEMATYVELVKTARPRTALLGETWPTAALAIMNAIQASIAGTASAEDALRTAQAEIDSAR